MKSSRGDPAAAECAGGAATRGFPELQGAYQVAVVGRQQGENQDGHVGTVARTNGDPGWVKKPGEKVIAEGIQTVARGAQVNTNPLGTASKGKISQSQFSQSTIVHSDFPCHGDYGYLTIPARR